MNIEGILCIAAILIPMLIIWGMMGAGNGE